MTTTTTTKEQEEESSSSLIFQSHCCCPCCSSSFTGEKQEEGGENSNWWKKRRKMKMKRNYESWLLNTKREQDEEDHEDDYNDDNNPVQQDCYHPSQQTQTQDSDSNCVLRSKILICDYEPVLFSHKMRRNFGGINIGCTSTRSFVTFTNFLVIFITFLLAISSSRMVNAFPTNDCDWSGSGTPENVVQAVYLRCQQGHILWERPRGGLRIILSPPKYFKALGQRDTPFRLCLETTNVGTNFQVFLEQITDPSENSGNEERRKLLPFIAPKKKSSTCYRISSSTATLYVESQSQQEDQDLTIPTTLNTPKDAYQVKISYEIEELKTSQEEGFSDDECRPCSDSEVLQLYCVADVVAQGEILSVLPSNTRKDMDNLYIKSNLVIHQNYPVFQPLKSGNKNLQKFLLQEISLFDQDSPKRMSKQGKSSYFGGVVSHPSKCAAQSGPGEFLWLVKLSFGRPKIGCVVYWDKWVQLAMESVSSKRASCPLTYQ